MLDLEARKAKILQDPKSEYMNEEQLSFFKDLLVSMSQKTLEQIQEAKQDITQPSSDVDPIDIATLESERALKLKIIDRQTKLLIKIDEALNMIEQGSYGYCVETGEEIGLERLMLRPTANLSVDAKSIREESEKDYGSDNGEN